MMLKCVGNCGPRHCLELDVEKFSSSLYKYKYIEISNEKNVHYSQRVILRYCYIFVSILYFLIARKKIETKKYLKATDSPLATKGQRSTHIGVRDMPTACSNV